jgi:acetyl esterase/lipase
MPDVKKHYRLYRTMTSAVHPYLKPIYHTLDRRIMAGDREIPVRVFYPRHKDASKVLLFFHGGGWVTGTINSYNRVCAVMARQTGRTVISVDYRLAPEHPYPAGLEDCYEAAAALFRSPEMIRCTCRDITLVGDSAGGNLAAVVSLMARNRGQFLPRRQILLYPSTYWDHGPGSPFPSIRENGKDYILTAQRVQNYMELYAPAEADRQSPYVSPLLAEDLSGQPDTLIITAQYDPLRDEGEAYGRKLREFGTSARVVCIDDALHGFLMLPQHSRPVKECYEIIRSFLGREEYSG